MVFYRLCLVSSLARAAVRLSIWWRGGRVSGRCWCRAARLSRSDSRECAGGASCSYRGFHLRAPAWRGEPGHPGRVRPALSQCGAWTLLLFLPRLVILCSTHLSTQDKIPAVICKISSSLFFSCFPFFSVKLTTASRCSCIPWTCAACYVNTAAWRPVLNPSPPQWWR